MGTRRRRRIDAVLLAAAVLLVGVAAAAAAVAARTERIAGLWAGAQVAAGGAARIVEVIDYDFGSQPRHGIFRDVPGLDPADPVQVASPSAPAQVEVTGTAHQTRLRIGDPERTVTGRHRYTIAYRLAGVAPGGRLAWDAVGTSWPVGIAEAELHVAAPYRLEDARCVQGATGSAEPCRVAQPEPGHLVATVEGLDAGEGVTLYASAGARLPAAPALPAPPPPPADPGTGPIPPALVAAAAALAGAIPTSWLVRRAGRERVATGGAAEAAFGPAGRGARGAGGAGAGAPVDRIDAADLAGLATVEFVPPRELTPAQGGVLLAEAVRPEHQVAWLIGAAVDGHLDLEDDGGHGDPGPAPPPRRGRQLPARRGLRRPRPPHPGQLRPELRRRLGAGRPRARRLAADVRPVGPGRRPPAGARPGLRGRRRGRRPAPDRHRCRPGRPVGAGLAGPGGAGRAAGRGGRGRGRARLGAAGPDPGRLRAVAADRVVPAVPGRLGGPPRRGGGQARPPARVHRLGGRRRRAGPLARAVAASSAAAADPAAARYPLLAPALLSGASGSSARPSSSGSGGGGGGGVGGGAGGGGGGSW